MQPSMQLGTFVNMPMLAAEEIKRELLFWAERGVNVVGLVFDYPWGPHSVSDEWKRKLKAAVKKARMQTVVHAPFTANNILSLCRKHREMSIEEIRLSVDLARRLGSHSVTFHAGSVTPYSKRVNLSDIMKDSISEICSHAKKSGVAVSVENLLPGISFRESYPVTPEQMEELVRISPEIRFCIDVGHAHRAGMNVTDFVKRFINRTNCMHIHDATRTSDHLVAGSGEIDFGEIFEVLKGAGFRDPVLIENKNLEECLESWKRLKGLAAE